MTIDADFGAGGAAEEKCLCTGLSGSLWVSFGSGLSGSGVSPGLSGSRLGRSDRFELFLLLFSQFFLFIFFFFYCCRAAHVAGVAPLRKSARSCADSGCCCRLPRTNEPREHTEVETIERRTDRTPSLAETRAHGSTHFRPTARKARYSGGPGAPLT